MRSSSPLSLSSQTDSHTSGFGSDEEEHTAPTSVAGSFSDVSLLSKEDDIPLPESFGSTNEGESPIFSLLDSFPSIPKHIIPEAVADADISTPDRWIKRNPELVRLTGKHPFNSEARLNRLFDAGFITPSHLFYVRNHGAVPYVEQEMANRWRLRIHGLVENEVELSLHELKTLFPVVTLPVTFVCAGNRRKEQNVVSKSLGFSWGAAGVSTGLFTGVYLCDLLNYAKPLRPAAKHVIFEGIDKLPNGAYGTSQRLSWASDRSKGMLISWSMNGLPLEPDHGFPLRVVIPGQIGGRSVKWLNRIEVSNEESQHYLHFWDNKVLPTEISAEQARSEKKWWYDPKYIINELNVNSAIARPDHDEVLDLNNPSSNPSFDVLSNEYGVQGYAYAGGGRRVNRVEISLDDGDTWKIADITYPEDLFRAVCYSDSTFGTLDLTERDTYFCWCFWKFNIPLDDLAQSSSIAVRAMDESLVLQQRDMYWNPTGMMNNWWFRVAIHKIQEVDRVLLRFEHPTLAGTAPGGWMERLKVSGMDPSKPNFGSSAPVSKTSSPKSEVAMTNPNITRVISFSDLKSQDHSNPWFVVNGEVYDGTGFMSEHPGGADSILLVAGEDASEDFMAIHSPEGKMKLAKFHIGTLGKAGPDSAASASNGISESPIFLSRTQWSKARLIDRQAVSHDSFIFRFAFSDPSKLLGLPSGQHVFVRLKRKDNGELVQRAYTPVSSADAVGHVELLIKLYLPCTAFPEGGKMTIGFHHLTSNDEIELKGPLGSFVWLGKGKAKWKDRVVQPGSVGLICGGSGITPILQVLRAILNDAEDITTKLSVLTSNKTRADILCYEELNSFLAIHSAERYRVHHTIGMVDEPDTWKGSVGRIDDKMLSTCMPDSSNMDAIILVCGPDAMVEMAVKPGLRKLGWDVEKSVVVF